MKNRYFVVYSILLLSMMLMLSPGESVSQANLQIGGGIGYAIPAGDLGGTTSDYYAGSRYGMSDGFNLHAKGRVDLAIFRLVGEIGYTAIRNEGESEPGKGKVDISQKIFSIKAGPEFQFNVPGVPFTPYIGANVALNNFSGDVTFNGVAKVPSGTFSVQSATRFGFGISGGAIVKIGATTALDIGIAYGFLNLIGRDWEDANPTKDERIDSYTSLNDEKDPVKLNSDEHFIGSARAMQSIQITASVLFEL